MHQRYFFNNQKSKKRRLKSEGICSSHAAQYSMCKYNNNILNKGVQSRAHVLILLKHGTETCMFGTKRSVLS